jgi:hypothetical protein
MTCSRIVMTAAVAGLATFPACAPLGAGDDLVPNRPGEVEGAERVRAGDLNVEAGYRFTTGGSERTHALGDVQLRFGASEQFELRGVVPYATRGADGWAWEDARAGGKLGLPDTGPFDASLIAGVTLPTGSAGLGAGGLQPELGAGITVEPEGSPAILINVGSTLLHEDGSRPVSLWGGIAVDQEVGERFGASAEISGGRTLRTGMETEARVGVGFRVVLTPSLQADAWAATGVRPEWGEHAFGFGVSHRLRTGAPRR